ncbi:hypothetical protein MKY34_00520 [Sporosarcina sp. FSL K6-1522]|uniref:hypothetical protein n=1 Tax=Sporosarcina sp. FSL K6-1522 TaxID=2921554 RepID=UPI00315AED93
MNGTITQYMGTAYTGRGISHKYDKLIATATTTYFLKCPPTNAISDVLNETATLFVRRGYDVDRFMDPIQPEKTDAVFVKGANLFFIQASHPVALEPADIGGRHRVISFYDIYDEVKLRGQNALIVDKLAEAEVALGKALQALADAKRIHDDWEAVNIRRMMWEQHENLIQSLKEELFGTIRLNKQTAISHRLIGSLTSRGAQDFIPSITKGLERRILIKGLPGTGKSTLMKALGAEAEKRGFDVLYGWCGLDPAGVDLVQFPELSLCILDATQPHVYDPELPGDEVLDLVQMCVKDAEAEKEIERIRDVYAEKMLDATGYMQTYAQAENSVKIAMDGAIQQSVFDKKSQVLLELP